MARSAAMLGTGRSPGPTALVGLCVLIQALAGCVAAGPYRAGDGEGRTLARALVALSPRIHADDARRMATAALRATAELGADYRMVRPAATHNLLVRAGLKTRGLCCHWAEDLRRRLSRIDAPSIRLAWVVAHRGHWLREHNSLVFHAIGDDWRSGLVFDPWRDAGTPTWAPAAADTYPWVLHPHSGDWNALRCRRDLAER